MISATSRTGISFVRAIASIASSGSWIHMFDGQCLKKVSMIR